MIKAIIFDFGGVLTVGKHTDSIIKLLEKRFNVSIKNHKPSFGSFMDLIDFKGVSFEEFVKKVNKEFGLKTTTEEISGIFGNAIIPNKEVMNLVQKLKKRYKTIMLSDNNEPTIRILRKQHKDLINLFEKTYFSCEVKMHKPNKDFFEFVLKELNVNAEECIFIDDKQKNVKAAEKLGMKTILFESTEQFIKDLKRLGVKI